MDAAFENPLVEAGLGEHRARRRDMVLTARMRCAGKRNLLVAEPQAVSGAAFDERESLQRLDGRARIDRPRCVAERHHNAAVRIDDRARAPMGGFDPFAAGGLHDYRIRHRLRFPQEGQDFQRHVL